MMKHVKSISLEFEFVIVKVNFNEIFYSLDSITVIYIFKNHTEGFKMNKNKNIKDSADVPVPPPVYFILCLGIAFMLEYLFPVDLKGLPWSNALLLPNILGVS
jgi:hypothetical protein